MKNISKHNILLFQQLIDKFNNSNNNNNNLNVSSADEAEVRIYNDFFHFFKLINSLVFVMIFSSIKNNFN